MITLLEASARSAAENGNVTAWSRTAGAPAILRDGAPYDPHLDRFLADLPLTSRPPPR